MVVEDQVRGGIRQDSVLQIIVLPKRGRVDDVVVARVFWAALPFVIQMAIEANCAASGALDDSNPELVIPADLVTISSDLHARVLKDTMARDDILDSCRECDEADDAVSMFGTAWRGLFFGDQAQERLSEISISGRCDAPSLTVRVEAPWNREAMEAVW